MIQQKNMLVDIIILHAYFIYPSLIFFWFDWYICACAKLSNKSIRLNYFLISSKIQLNFLSGFSTHFSQLPYKQHRTWSLSQLETQILFTYWELLYHQYFPDSFHCLLALLCFNWEINFHSKKARYFYLSLRNEILRKIRHRWKRKQGCLDWMNFLVEMELKLNI